MNSPRFEGEHVINISSSIRRMVAWCVAVSDQNEAGAVHCKAFMRVSHTSIKGLQLVSFVASLMLSIFDNLERNQYDIPDFLPVWHIR
jgi:hypothetical protein